MAGHEKQDRHSRRSADASIAGLGREIQVARLGLDVSQATAARAMGRSAAWWSRMERGRSSGLRLVDLARALGIVGLDLHIRAYPGGRGVRDRAHLRLLERLRAELGPDVGWRTEVPLPNPGDRRAWDAMARPAGVRVGIEAETRARDAQALQRRLSLKRRDGGVDHLILLLADTRSNRAFLRAAGSGFLADFPVPGKVALARLSAGEDPGGSAIILL